RAGGASGWRKVCVTAGRRRPVFSVLLGAKAYCAREIRQGIPRRFPGAAQREPKASIISLRSMLRRARDTLAMAVQPPPRRPTPAKPHWHCCPLTTRWGTGVTGSRRRVYSRFGGGAVGGGETLLDPDRRGSTRVARQRHRPGDGGGHHARRLRADPVA